MHKIKFGTDGWRAVIAEDFTFENVKIVTQAIADYLGAGAKIVLGYDTRFLGDRFAKTIASVLTANGVNVILSDSPTSTPAVSLCIKQNGLDGGIVVTASHNPSHYNGIKFKGRYAGPADPDIISKIESRLGKSEIKQISIPDAVDKGLLTYKNLNLAHERFLKSYLDISLLRRARYKILVDIMYGAGDHLFQKVLKNTNCKVEIIHTDNNPGFGGTQPEPIKQNLKELIKIVKRGNYDIGLATDGDVDRIGTVDENGNFISPLKIISLLLLHLIEDKNWRGAVVKTIACSYLIDKIAQTYGLKIYETPVGFKHICKIMQSEDVLLGGEESGGIGFKNYVPERDGTLAGLLVVEMMAQRRKPLSRILKDMQAKFGNFYQERIDLKYPNEKKKKLFNHLKNSPPHKLLDKKISYIQSYDGIKFIAEDKSWILFRASGTEPILRIYAEAHTKSALRKLLNFGKTLVYKV